MPSPQAPRPLRVMVYSDDLTVRRAVITALGTRPDPDLPELEFIEVATGPVVVRTADAGGLDLMILDGEATPTGGLGLTRQLKDEIHRCPPILVLTGRPQDAWLATWSRADAVVGHPIEPGQLAEAVSDLLRTRLPATTRP
jgi:DNA-binding response OmpR family regulator